MKFVSMRGDTHRAFELTAFAPKECLWHKADDGK